MRFHKRLFSFFIFILSGNLPVLAQWEQTNITDAGDSRQILAIGNRLYAPYYKGVLRSSDNGDLPAKPDTILKSERMFGIAAASKYLFAFGIPGVFRSEDEGRSWTTMNNGLYPSIYPLIVKDSLMFVGSYDGISSSQDWGANWYSVNSKLVKPLPGAFATMGRFLFVGTADGIFRSSNRGATWDSASSGLEKQTSLLSMAANGKTLFAGSRYGMYRSLDSGGTWTLLNNDLSKLFVYSFAVVDGKVFAASKKGVYASADDGVTWTSTNNDTSEFVVTALASNETYLFAGADRKGVWRRRLSELGVTAVRPSVKDEGAGFERNLGSVLRAGSPIGFTIRSAGRAVLSLSDISGRTEIVLMDGAVAKGAHRIDFNPGALPKGIYFLRLLADGVSSTHLCILARD